MDDFERGVSAIFALWAALILFGYISSRKSAAPHTKPQ
jgi:hypothetical protein